VGLKARPVAARAVSPKEIKMKLADYRKISTQINAEITETLKRHELNVTKLRASIVEEIGTIRLTIEAADTNMKDASGNTVTPEAQRYTQYGELYGLKPEWLGRTFKMGRSHVGLRANFERASFASTRDFQDDIRQEVMR
jgi:hypothetical protein